MGLIKNKYVGRTFIAPSQDERLDKVRIKLSAIAETVRGKRVVLVDDSIVRGTTSARIVALLREAGAAEVHLRISAPPFLHACYYGTDVDSEENLVARGRTAEEIAQIIGADSLGYLPIESLDAITGGKGCCRACFDGNYPTPIPANTKKNRFETKLGEKNR
ncbi:MAG: phosphoribosyltransferase family protein [Slackia sp.]